MPNSFKMAAGCLLFVFQLLSWVVPNSLADECQSKGFMTGDYQQKGSGSLIRVFQRTCQQMMISRPSDSQVSKPALWIADQECRSGDYGVFRADGMSCAAFHKEGDAFVAEVREVSGFTLTQPSEQKGVMTVQKSDAKVLSTFRLSKMDDGSLKVEVHQSEDPRKPSSENGSGVREIFYIPYLPYKHKAK